jgi:hypothetical protein
MAIAGTPGTTGGMTGSAAADELSATATAPNPAAAIALAANNFAKRDMCEHSLDLQVLNPEGRPILELLK